MSFEKRIVVVGALALIAGAAVGLSAGLLLGWVFLPVEYYDVDPADLRPEHKEDYILMVASTFAVDGDFASAQTRLGQLGDPDIGVKVARLAEACVINGAEDATTRAVCQLANALGSATDVVSMYLAGPEAVAASSLSLVSGAAPPTATPTEQIEAEPGHYIVQPGDALVLIAEKHGISLEALMAANGISDPELIAVGQDLVIPPLDFTTPTPIPSPTLLPPTATPLPAAPAETATPPPTSTDSPTPTAPPSPTAPPIATPTLQSAAGAEYRVIEKYHLTCEENHQNHHIFAYVRDASGAGIPGIRLRVWWPDGEEFIVTGLKPEIDPGFVDFAMYPGYYSIEVYDGLSEIADGLTTELGNEECPSHGNTLHHHSWRVIFQRTW